MRLLSEFNVLKSREEGGLAGNEGLESLGGAGTDVTAAPPTHAPHDKNNEIAWKIELRVNLRLF